MAEHDSCLAKDQSGGVRNPPLPDDPGTDYGVEVASLADAAEEMLSAAVAAPRVTRYYQGRACSAMKRTKADIDQVVIHTPEGGESGTLSVLNGTGASFDWFLPLSGSLYRCNDYFNYVAWQAGHWETNLRSIGIEQGDYASRSGSFGDAHYKRLAQLSAYLAETLDLKIARARGIGQAGFVSHADITPGSRTDPGAGFLWDKLLDYTLDYRQGRTPGNPAPTRPTPGTLYRVRCGSFSARANADALVARLKKAGYGALAIPEDGAHNVYAGSFSVRENADRLAAKLKRKGFEAVVVRKGTAPKTASKVDKAVAYELELVDPPTDYGFWDGEFPFTPGPAMWANVKPNQAPDPKTQVPNASCTGLINLGNAAAGISYRSGTLGYARDLVNKRPYKPGMVVKKGEVLLDRYMETSNEDEGHIVQAIETGTNPLVISSDHRFGGVKPGVNVHRLSDSYKLFDYDWVGEVPGLGTA